MLESIFEFLFKYRPLVFEKARWAFSTPWPLTLVAIAVGLVVLTIGLAYSRARGTSLQDRLFLAGLRAAALAIVAFCLARPTLLVPTVVPQQNFLGILIDDSRSMQIADMDPSRSAFVRREFGAPDSALRKALSERFLLRFFRFSERTERFEDLTTLTGHGDRTDIAQALETGLRELEAVPLAGLIVISDGADNASSSLTEVLLGLKASSVPVYAVGLGRESFARDIEISRVETPRAVLKGSSLVVDLAVTQTGYRNKTVRVDVESDGRIVASQDVRLADDGEPASVRVQFTANEPGPQLFRFRISPQPDEQVSQNNERTALIVVEDRRDKILYFEGQPRFEVAFTRRAVADDENLQLVTLVRTADNKFLRLDVDDADELAAGFPRRREELFAYRGLVLGSVEASSFSYDQLRMIEEFVGQRGGGLLVLGGRHALDRGGYSGTPIADVLPVHLPDESAAGTESFFAELTVEPTRTGQSHPATQIAETMEASIGRWRELPPLSAVNRILEVKPGAVMLLQGSVAGLSDPLVVLAHQRYGRGKSLALPVQDVWAWQMHADIPLDDLTHERFWRQVLRWLVSYVPDRVEVTPSRDRVGPGDVVDITAQIQDETFLSVNNAEVTATVTSPTGLARELPLQWAVEADGEYHMSLNPEEKGLHRVSIAARKDGALLGERTTFVEVGELNSEYFDAEMRADLLRRVADETGGRFYTPDNVATLPEDVSVTESGTTVIEERSLWDMPLVFLLLITFLGAEWGFRRWRGLA